jgi:hypothetical protein
MSSLRNERGQAVVLMVLFVGVMLALGAAVLDVGAWYRADRKLQATADASALAGAQGLPDSQSEAMSLALSYSDKNDGGVDSSGVSFSTTVVAGDTISVHAQKPMPGFFSKVFGIASVNVGADAKARTGVMSSAKWAAPVAVDEQHEKLQCKPTPCFNEATTLDFEKVGPGAFRLMNIDGSYGGTGPPDIGRWINEGLDAYMPLGWYYSDPGIKPNSSHIKGALEARDEDELLFPVYRQTREQGAGFEYEVVGWVGFHITDYEIQGVKNARIKGWFTKIIWEGIQSETSGDPDFGARAVTLLE